MSQPGHRPCRHSTGNTGFTRAGGGANGSAIRGTAAAGIASATPSGVTIGAGDASAALSAGMAGARDTSGSACGGIMGSISLTSLSGQYGNYFFLLGAGHARFALADVHIHFGAHTELT